LLFLREGHSAVTVYNKTDNVGINEILRRVHVITVTAIKAISITHSEGVSVPFVILQEPFFSTIECTLG
jgi:hypothetical protein